MGNSSESIGSSSLTPVFGLGLDGREFSVVRRYNMSGPAKWLYCGTSSVLFRVTGCVSICFSDHLSARASCRVETHCRYPKIDPAILFLVEVAH